MSLRISRLALMSLLTLAACSSDFPAPATQLVTSLDQTTYKPGSTVYFTLTNVSDKMVEYGWVGIQLQHSTRTDQWESTNIELPGRAMAYMLAPGKVVTLDFPLPDSLHVGIYRIVNKSPEYQTKSFTVEADSSR